MHIVESQFPGELLHRLGLKIELEGDAYFLRTVLRIKNDERGLDLKVDLEPMAYGRFQIRAKVPELIILHLCTMVS